MKTIPAIVVLLAAGTSYGQWGSLSGQFVLDGDIPAAVKITVDKDKEVCTKTELIEETLTVDAKSKGIADIIVYMYLSKGAKVKAHPDYDKTAKDEVVMDNSLCRFEPRVTLLRTTQTLIIKNSDPVGHNTKIDALSNPGINPLIPGNGMMKQQFAAGERRPLIVSCNIHPWMKSRLVVQEHPYMAKTDKDGKFKIEKIPAGDWTFQFYHEKYVGAKKGQMKIAGKEAVWKKGRSEFKIADGKDTAIGKAEISVSAFVKK